MQQYSIIKFNQMPYYIRLEKKKYNNLSIEIMMRPSPLAIAFLLIIIPLLACSTQLEKLAVNSLTLSNLNQSQSQIYIHKFQNTFEESPQLALAITGYECSKYLLDTSFHIMPEAITSGGFTLTWQRNIQKWSKIHINYMASTRSDIFLGYAHANIRQSCTDSSNQLTLTTALIPRFSSSIFRTFLLGCDLGNSSIKCGIFPKGLTNTSITVTIQRSGLQNGTISFSFIIFSPSASSFTSYGGFISKQNFNGYFATDLHKSIGYTPYKLQGLSYLQSENLNSMKSNINTDFIFRMATNSLIDKFAIFYIIIGKSSKAVCSNQSLSYQYGEECLAICPANTYPYSYADGGFYCKICSEILNLTLANGRCIPINQSQSSLPTIQKDQRTQERHQQHTQTKPPQIQQQKTASIISDTSSNSCQENAFLLNGKCTCKVGYSKIGATCYPIVFQQPEVIPTILQGIHIFRNISIYNDPQSEGLQASSNAATSNIAININTSPSPILSIPTNTILSVSNNPESTNITTSSDNSNPTNIALEINNSATASNTTNTDNSSTIATSDSNSASNTNSSQNICTTSLPNQIPKSQLSNSSSSVLKEDKKGETADLVLVKQKIASLQLSGEIKANSNQFFIILDTGTPLDFSDQNQMKNFLKAKFKGCQPPTYYCLQQQTKKNLFDCLFIFPSGIPNKSFTTTFSYSYKQKQASLLLQIDSLKIMMNSSKRKTNSKQIKNTKTS